MSKIIIAGNPKRKKEAMDKNMPQLKIAEFFSRTLQGEGTSVGTPSAFLRVKDCTLNCTWCDSAEVWRFGNSYSVFELLDLMLDSGLVEDLKNGHHLVLTGGSPVKQQENLSTLIALFQVRHGFIPYIEVENECVLRVDNVFASFVSQWNNSPKLTNSEMKRELCYKPGIITQAARFNNSWFKFVISQPEDWIEIFDDYLMPGLIDRSQIILMPCGMNRQELDKSREMVADIAIRENVLFSDRLHVTLWNQKTGV
jgi:organic radical activating enzyme